MTHMKRERFHIETVAFSLNPVGVPAGDDRMRRCRVFAGVQVAHFKGEVSYGT